MSQQSTAVAVSTSTTPFVSPILLTASRLGVKPGEAGATAAIIRGLLEDDLGCRLPCWWGIVPHQTTLTAAREILSPLDLGPHATIQTTYTTADGLLIEPVYDGWKILQFEIRPADRRDEFFEFWSKNGVIDHIKIVLNSAYATPPTIRSDWQNYYLGHILATYGVPSKVFLAFDRYSRRDVAIILFFEDQNIFVTYNAFHGVPDSEGRVLEICPHFEDIGQMRFILSSPESGTEISQSILDDYFDDEYPPQTLEEVTSLDNQSFHNLFVNSNENVCFETLIDQ